MRFLLLFVLLLSSYVYSDDRVRAFIPEIRGWVNDLVIDSIRAQNERHAKLTMFEIDRLDHKWRRETTSGNQPMIEGILANKLSEYLYGIRKKSDRYTEIFVVDNRGLNVGQSDPTSDYWQGDEPKWVGTFLAGPDAVHIGLTEFDESTQTKQVQLSLSIADPDTGEVIGTITVGIDVDAL